MVYGYIRVSTDKQELDNQKYELFTFAHSKNLKIDTFIEESVTGSKNYKDRLLGSLINTLNKGDTLLITELSRLGRSLMQIMEILGVLMERGVFIFVSKGNMEIGNNIQSKVLAFAFGLSAEIEKELISSRTKEALAKIKASGKKLGRPEGKTSKSKLDTKEDDIRMYLQKGVSKRAICKILDIKESTFYNFCKTRGIF